MFLSMDGQGADGRWLAALRALSRHVALRRCIIRSSSHVSVSGRRDATAPCATNRLRPRSDEGWSAPLHRAPSTAPTKNGGQAMGAEIGRQAFGQTTRACP